MVRVSASSSGELSFMNADARAEGWFAPVAVFGFWFLLHIHSETPQHGLSHWFSLFETDYSELCLTTD